MELPRGAPPFLASVRIEALTLTNTELDELQMTLCQVLAILVLVVGGLEED